MSKQGLNDGVEELYEREVAVPSGGKILIEYCETLTAIDVNAGNTELITRGDNAILRVNKLVAMKIAQQIVARNISGMIIIDFLRIKNPSVRSQLPKIFSTCMKNYDPDGVWDVLGVTKAGLLEVTRKRTHNSLGEIVLGSKPSPELNKVTKGINLLHQLATGSNIGTPFIRAPHDIIDSFKSGELKFFKDKAQSNFAKEIKLEVDSNIDVGFKN